MLRCLGCLLNLEFCVRYIDSTNIGITLGMTMRVGLRRIGPPHIWPIKCGSDWPVPLKICEMILLARPAYGLVYGPVG